MSLPAYPEYKESGVHWLGQVPSHWRVDRLKASITSCRNGIWGGEPNDDEDDIECVRVADFDRSRLAINRLIPTRRSVSQSERSGRLLKRGDLLLEKSGGGEKQPVGQVVIYDRDEPAVCSNFVAKVSLADGMVPRFWMYKHAAAYANGVNVVAIKQTSGIQNLDQSQYFDERGAFPPQEEQLLIADFLDRETAKIDALIAEQETLLDLLAEKRQATISHAVTRGLDPNVPMKHSGIAWLGEVPAHWTTPPLHLRYSCDLGKMLDTAKISGAHLVPYLRNTDVQWGRLNFEALPEMDIRDAEYERFTVAQGDLLVCEGGEVGRAAVVGELPGVIGFQKALHRLRAVTAEESSRFMYYTFEWAARHGVFNGGGQATIAHLTGEQLRAYRFAKPPLAEQEAIAKFLDAAVAALELLRAEVLDAISLLKERRSALIAAVVTGKVDVRGLA